MSTKVFSSQTENITKSKENKIDNSFEPVDVIKENDMNEEIPLKSEEIKQKEIIHDEFEAHHDEIDNMHSIEAILKSHPEKFKLSSELFGKVREMKDEVMVKLKENNKKEVRKNEKARINKKELIKHDKKEIKKIKKVKEESKEKKKFHLKRIINCQIK